MAGYSCRAQICQRLLRLNNLFKNTKFLLYLLVGGLFTAEAILSLWTGLKYDMQIWFKTGYWMSTATNIYLPNNHMGYPPLWAFWALVANRIYGVFGYNIEIWRFLIKLPLIIGQFILAFVVKRFAQTRFDEKTTNRIFLFTLTWSFFIYISALWGQINILSALFTFLAFFAIVNKQTILSGVFLGIAVTLKIYPLILLPAFILFLWKNQKSREMWKLLILTLGIPTAFTIGVFAVYRWDIIYFLKTVFYWTPAFDANPILIQGGCMNIWSALSLINIDISQITILRFLWIPILGAAFLFWIRKKQMNEADLNLAIISFYLLFMISYSWISEQTFLDPLPFIILFVFGYRPKKSLFYGLIAVQVLVFMFSTFNWGPFIFEPLLSRFAPNLLEIINPLDPATSPLVWTIRGWMGLFVSLSLAFFLILLVKPNFTISGRKRSENFFSAAKSKDN